MDILFYAVTFIVALGVLIVVHEFGHFWVARRCGVKVLRFSVGFGRPLWRRAFGADRTEVVVAAIPLGGYVKMLDEAEAPVPAAELARAFNRQKVWKRAAIVVAGPAFNFLFAILAYWAVFVVGIDGIRPVVGKVTPDSIAARAGFEAGDEILAIDGQAVQSWGQRRLYLFRRALDRAVVDVEVRDWQQQTHVRRLDLTTLPSAAVDASLLERGIGLFGYLPEISPVVGGIEDGPARSAGLQIGDRFVSIDGRPIRGWDEVVTSISARPGQPTTIVVERDGARRTFQVTPASVTHGERTIGRINIRPQVDDIPAQMLTRVRFGPIAAFGEAFQNTWAMTALTFQMLYRMVTLEVSSKNISGPITIAQYAGQSAKIGGTQFVLFLAVISISLAVLNLLPIPVLDGGHLLYYVIEIVKGSPVSERVMVLGQQVGIALLAGLMVLAFYNDLTRIFG
ncbi:MAG TPA: RIP metalloprotease RseP [Burkholderiales bacterium]